MEKEEKKQKQLKEEVVFILKLEDHQLSDKIERLRKQISSPLALKLPDKGEKCRRCLKICEDELEKRNQLRPRKTAECENSNPPQKAENANSNQSPQKDVNENSNLSPQSAECDNSKQLPQKDECENSKQSQNPCSPVAYNDCSSETPPLQTCSQTKVDLLLQKPVEKENLSAGTSVVPFHEELPMLHHGNHPHRSSGGQQLNRRWEYRLGHRWQYENEHRSPLGADADESPDVNRRCLSENERRPPFRAQDADFPRFNRSHPYAYYPRRSFKRRIQPERAIPTLHRILGNLLEDSTTHRPHYQSRFGVPPADSQMAELICTMEQQLETVHTHLAGIESQVTTRMDMLDAKLEQIIQIQTGNKSETGNKSTKDATSEIQRAKSVS